MTDPFGGVVIAAAANSRQAKYFETETSLSLCIEATKLALDAAGISPDSIDGVAGETGEETAYALGIGPTWGSRVGLGVRAVLESALAIRAGLCSTVLIVAGRAGTYRDHTSTAPWTRRGTEFTATVGVFNAVEFALEARRHMHLYGTTAEQMSRAAATIRNNGHVNPEAVFYGKGPYTTDDVLASRMVSDPFRLLDCCITSEGACAIVLTKADRTADLALRPVRILGGGIDSLGPPHHNPPVWEQPMPSDGDAAGYVGRRAARLAFAMSGLGPADVDLCELYDPFSFEIIRQLEAFGFCGDGEGGQFVEEGNIEPGGRLPVNTDGGLLSYSHAGGSIQGTQRIVRAVHQLQRTCQSLQLPNAEVALASYGGSAVFFTDVILLGRG